MISLHVLTDLYNVIMELFVIYVESPHKWSTLAPHDEGGSIQLPPAHAVTPPQWELQI